MACDSCSSVAPNLPSTRHLCYPEAPLPSVPIQPLVDTLSLGADELHEVDVHSLRVFEMHVTLFPDECLRIKPRAMVRALDQTLYDRKGRRWLFENPPPSQTPSEKAVATAAFLNELTRRCWLAYQARRRPVQSITRQWVVVEHLRPSATGETARSFGIALVDAGSSSARWEDVLCNVQIVTDASQMPEAHLRLSISAAHVLSSQDDRLFYLGLALAGDKYQLAYYDCAGRVLSGLFDVHECPVYFARMLMGLSMADSSRIGKDPALVSRGKQRFLTMARGEYEVVETLAIDKRIFGHGTVYWRCRREDGDDVIVKSTWAKAGPPPTEGDRFRNAYVDGVPDLICEEPVFRAHDQPWSTMWIRDTLEGQERMSVIGRIRQLELRRLVFDMAGRPLKEFESKVELIQALRDTIYAHKHLFYSCRVLQYNINPVTIMLHRPPNKSRRWGTLVDLNHASPTGTGHFEGSAFVGPRVGSFAFIACRLIPYMDSGHRHTPQHDFESYIHLLMYMCASYSGPSNTPRDNFDIRESPMAPWFNGDTDERFRIMFRLGDGEFRAFLDSLFDPYFDDLKDLVCELRTLILRTPDVTPCHYTLLGVFDRYIAALQAPPPLPEPVPATRQRVLDIPTAIETKRTSIVKQKRPSALVAPAAATPPPTPAVPIRTPASPGILATNSTPPSALAPSTAIAPSPPAAPSSPTLSTTSRAMPPHRLPSRPMTRAMRRRLAEPRRAASLHSDGSHHMLVETTPEREGILPDSPSLKRKLSVSRLPEDRRTSPRRSERLASPDAPSDESPLHATRASKRRKGA
ncbi:hypothetical protein EV714DRAFT_212055 [Schizophyllum commune]